MNNNYHFIDLCRLSRKVPDALALIGGSLCKGNDNDPFSDAGTHYNPSGCPHPYHAGDLFSFVNQVSVCDKFCTLWDL